MFGILIQELVGQESLRLWMLLPKNIGSLI